MSLTFSISVPIGAYHPLLADCLQSLAIQTPRPAVALLDASGDPRVTEVADRFKDLISYRRHGPDKGQSDAILEGWREVPGDILGWLNADDALYPDALAAAVERLTSPDRPDVVYGHSTIVNDDNEVTGYHWAVEPPSDYLLAGDIISQPSCFFRRAAYDKAGGLDAALHYTMDWDLWVRLWRDGARFAFIDETLSRVLWTPDAKTGGYSKTRRAELNRIINQNASPVRRLKSKIGFALNHAFEYALPASLARVLRRGVSKPGPFIHGLSPTGEIDGTAALPLVHYRETPVTKITVRFSGAASAKLSAEGGEASAETQGEAAASLALFEPLPSGKTLILSLENTGSTPAVFSSLQMD